MLKSRFSLHISNVPCKHVENRKIHFIRLREIEISGGRALQGGDLR